MKFNPLVPFRAVIEKKTQETENVFSIEINLEQGKKYLYFPGQFNMLGLPGLGESAVSVSSLDDGSNRVIHTVRAVGNVTNGIAGKNPGDFLEIRGPFGKGWPLDKIKGRNVIIAAGGLGMAPLRPVIYQILANRKEYKKVIVIYGARSAGEMLFKDELAQWSGSKDIELFLTADKAAKEDILNIREGVITVVFDKINMPLEDCVAFICGPEIMMHFASVQLIMKKHLPENIYVSLERRMKCGFGHCGHCQLGAKYVCNDGPVFVYNDIKRFADVWI